MIVQIRVEVTDEQRRELARRLRPNQMSKLATRKEVSAFLTHRLADLDTKAVGEAKPDPEPLVEDTAPVSSRIGIEKQGTGIKRCLFHVNNAMFAITNAHRALESDDHVYAGAVANVSGDIEALRETLVTQHDMEHAVPA